MGASERGIRGRVSWIGDTSNWLDRAEGARDRYDRELKARAAQEEQRQRALQQDEARKLTLDDDGFQILANAVLLAWFAPDPRADIDLQRIMFSERAELRGLLVSQGVDAEEWADLEGVSPVEVRDRLYQLRRGSAAFALVRPKDLHPMDGARLPELVDFALLGAKPSELRTPIGLLGRCPLTLSLRSVVLDYFRGVHVQAPDDAESCAAPGVPQPVFDASDRRFATEGALGVSRGLYPSANQAAKSLVEKYGLARTRTAAAQSGKIFGASPEAAVDRIGREIKKHLRSGMSR